MTNKEASLKAKLMERYSKEVDKLLSKSRETTDFGELEEQVSKLAEEILPATLSELQSSKDFSPSTLRMSREGKK